VGVVIIDVDDGVLCGVPAGRVPDGSLWWSDLPADLRARFTRRLAYELRGCDAETEWNRQTVAGRRDLWWHLTFPDDVRPTWEEDDQRSRRKLDQATGVAFRMLTDQANEAS
jgi:hypothetical protein